MAEIDLLFAYLTTLDVDGFIISPAYSYAAVNSKEIFMTREDIKAKFQAAEGMFRKYRFHSSPIYQEFLQGKREMQCTAWASPTRNIKGWKGPCYLITDTHHESLRRPVEQDRLGQLRLRERPALRELHGPRRLRDRGRRGRQQSPGRYPEDDQVATDLDRLNVFRVHKMGEQPEVAPRAGPADVGIVAALAIEMADLIDGLKSVRKYQSASFPVIEGEHGDKIVAVAIAGRAGRPPVAPTELLIAGHRPRPIISAGFAGALNPSFSRNDLIVPDEVIDPEGRRHRVDPPAILGATIRHAARPAAHRRSRRA